MSHQLRYRKPLILDCLNGTSENSKKTALETIKRNKSQMIILVYPIFFTGEEFRYDYGFPHTEWRRNPQAPGTKRNIDNIEAADSKNKISPKVDLPFITVPIRRNWKLSSNILDLK